MPEAWSRKAFTLAFEMHVVIYRKTGCLGETLPDKFVELRLVC